jgi:bacterioferritin
MDENLKNKAIDALNKIMEVELAGVVRYTHYSLMFMAITAFQS